LLIYPQTSENKNLQLSANECNFMLSIKAGIVCSILIGYRALIDRLIVMTADRRYQQSGLL